MNCKALAVGACDMRNYVAPSLSGNLASLAKQIHELIMYMSRLGIQPTSDTHSVRSCSSVSIVNCVCLSLTSQLPNGAVLYLKANLIWMNFSCFKRISSFPSQSRDLRNKMSIYSASTCSIDLKFVRLWKADDFTIL